YKRQVFGLATGPLSLGDFPRKSCTVGLRVPALPAQRKPLQRGDPFAVYGLDEEPKSRAGI
ncbi:MAG: hypothetical protein ACREDR_39565, partial [Blastocatellia bacterium]